MAEAWGSCLVESVHRCVYVSTGRTWPVCEMCVLLLLLLFYLETEQLVSLLACC